MALTTGGGAFALLGGAFSSTAALEGTNRLGTAGLRARGLLLVALMISPF